MKKTIHLFIAVFALLATAALTAQASEVSVLIDKLVEKNVLSAYDAQILKTEAEAEAAKKKVKENYVKTSLKGGLKFKTADGAFDMKIGGRIMADLLYLRGQDSLENGLGTDLRDNDNAFFRRVRLSASGTVYDDFFWKTQYDFAGTDASFKDVYMGMKNIPYLGEITLGQFKEPFGLNELTSSNSITFIERSLPMMFAPSRNWGVRVNNTWLDDRVTFAVGTFRDYDDGDNESGKNWSMTARMTGLPVYEDGGKKLVHVGAAYSLRKPDEGQLRYRQRPEMRTSDRFVDTGTFAADWESRIGTELGLVYGPFSVQGEFMQAVVDLDSTMAENYAYFYGGYGYVSFCLTGENRGYKKGSGAFSGIKPKNNFSIADRTWGAWEIAARYSHLNLNDSKAGISGGILNNMTAGLNWYLNPNMRIMANYVRTHRNGMGHADGLQARFHIKF